MKLIVFYFNYFAKKKKKRIQNSFYNTFFATKIYHTWTIPWFHSKCSPSIEVFLVLWHQVIILPRLRYHGNHSLSYNTSNNSLNYTELTPQMLKTASITWSSHYPDQTSMWKPFFPFRFFKIKTVQLSGSDLQISIQIWSLYIYISFILVIWIPFSSSFVYQNSTRCFLLVMIQSQIPCDNAASN